MPPSHDEFRREPITAKVLGSLGMVHSDREILVDLKVEMGRVDAMIVPDGADLFSLVDLLPLAHLNPVEVGVKGVREFQLPVLNPGMADDNYVSPGRMDVSGEHNQAISDRVNGFSKTAGTTAVGYEPVLSHVPPRAETAGFVISLPVGRSHGKVKSIGRLRNALGASRPDRSGSQDKQGSGR